MSDKILHTVQLAMILAVGIILLLYAHSYLNPELVFSSLIAGMGSMIGSRIAANNYAPTNNVNNARNEK